MSVEFIPDPHKGPGHGIITVSPLSCDASPTFAITNASTQACLSPEGWQSAEVFLQPQAWDCTNEQLRLAVGPEVVDHLDSLDMYRLQIKDAAGAITIYTLAISDIIHSSMMGGQGMGQMQATAPVTPVVEKEPEPDPTPEPEITEQPAPTSDPLPEMSMAQEEPAKKNMLPLILGVVILCALLGAGLWWYLSQQNTDPGVATTQGEEVQPSAEKSDTEQTEQTEQAKEEETTQAPAPAAQPQSSDTATENSTTVLSPMESARELLRQNATGDKSQTLATSLQAQAQNDAKAQDAIFLLFEDAAQKGVSAAMTALAGYYDPSHEGPKGSISPDAQEAYAWYTKAEQAGDASAKEHLARLHTWVTQEAQKGDATAKKLLQTWK